MENSINSTNLHAKIEELEAKQMQELNELKAQFKTTYTALHPMNLIKAAVHDIVTNKEIKTDLIDSAIGFAGGYVVKKLAFGKSTSFLSALAGDAVQLGVTNTIMKHPETIKSAFKLIVDLLYPSHQSNLPEQKSGLYPARKVIIKQILDLMDYVKMYQPFLYKELKKVQLPERNEDNQLDVISLREYRNKLRLEIIKYNTLKSEIT